MRQRQSKEREKVFGIRRHRRSFCLKRQPVICQRDITDYLYLLASLIGCVGVHAPTVLAAQWCHMLHGLQKKE